MGLLQTPEEQVNTIALPEELGTPSPIQDPENVRDYKSLMTAVSKSADLTELPENYMISSQQIQDGEEDSIRTNLATQQVEERQKTIKGLAEEAAVEGNVEDFEALVNSYNRYSTVATVDEQKPASLETSTTDKIQLQATNDHTQAKIMESPLVEDGKLRSFNEESRDKAIRYQMFAQAAEKLIAKWDSEQSTLGTATDFIGLLLPLSGVFEGTGNVETGDGRTTLTPGRRFNQEMDTLFNKMSLDEFKTSGLPAFLQKVEESAGTLMFNPTMAKMILGKALENGGFGTTDEAMREDILSIGLAAVGASQALKTGLNLSRVATVAGNSTLGAEVLASKMSTKTTEGTAEVLKSISQDQAVQDSIASAFTPITELAGTNIPEAVAQKLSIMEEVAKRVNDLQVTKTLSADEIETVSDQVKKELSKSLGRNTIVDIKVADNPSESITRTITRIGKNDGLGWAEKKSVANAMNRLGYTDYQVVRGVDGKYYGELNQAVAESQFLKGFDLGDVSKNPVNLVLQKYLWNPSSYMPAVAKDLLASSTFNESFLKSQVYKPLEEITKIGRKGQRTLDKVVTEARDLGKDLTYPELRASWLRHSGKPISDSEASAYYAAKQISNINWTILNKSLYEDLARQGKKTIEIDNPAINFTLDYEGSMATGRTGKVVTEVNQPVSNLRFFNANTGEKYTQGQMSPEKLQQMFDEGYQLVKLDDAVKVEGNPYNLIITKRQIVKQRELDPVQLAYKQGTIGSRLYAGKWFVKQANVKKFADGSGSYLMNPKTHAVGFTKAELQGWAGKWEDARKAYLEYKAGTKTRQEAEAIIGETGQVESVDDFEQLINDGEIIEDSPFEILFDRQVPNVGGTHYDMTSEISPIAEYYGTTGKAIYSPRGARRLSSPQDEAADVLDVFQSLSKGIQTAVRSGAYDSFRNAATEKWYKTADRAGAIKKGLSPYQALIEKDPYTSNVSPLLKSQLDTLRMPLVRQLDAKTSSGEMWKETMRSIGEWVEGKGEVGQKLAPKFYDDIGSANPITALRSFAFDLKLGLFSPGQLLVQSQQLFTALAISPVQGIKAMGAMPWIRWAVANGSDNVIDFITKNKGMKAMIGMDEAEFKLYMKELKNSGITDVGDSVIQLDRFGNSIHMNKVELGAQRVKEAGRVFFYEAEKWNRITAHNIAWREFKAKFPDAAMDNNAARNWIKSRTDDLSANMMSNSAAYWNKGILSFPTQFLAYMERILNQALPVMLGGSKRLTGAEKARLVAGQTLFYGTAGIPAGTWAYEKITESLGRSPTEAEYKNVTQGFLDSVLRNFLGADVNLSQRVAVGEGLENLYKQIATGEFTDVVLGPSFNIGGETYTSLRNVATLLSAGKGNDWDDVGEEALIEIAKNLSSFSSAFKAYYMHNYNVYISNTGKIVDKRDYSLGTEMMMLLGVTPSEVSAASDLYLKNKSISQGDEKRLTELVRQLHINALVRNDPAIYRRNYEIIQGITSGIENDPLKRRRLMQKIMGGFYKDTEYMKVVKENWKLEGDQPLNIIGRTTTEETQ